MGRKRAASMKPVGGRSARGQTPMARDRLRAPSQKDQIKRLKGLVKRHKSKDLRKSWQLGQLARHVLDQAAQGGAAPLSTRELGEKIGLIPKPDPSKKRKPDLATLYQLLKFAEVATEDQAAELQCHGVPWRAVPYWMGLKDGRRRAGLYRKMLSGLTDSEKIRKHMKTHYQHAAKVRSYVDLARSFANSQEVCDRLVDTLRNLNDRLGAKIKDGEILTTRDKRDLKAARRQLAASLKKVAKQVVVLESNLTSLP